MCLVEQHLILYYTLVWDLGKLISPNLEHTIIARSISRRQREAEDYVLKGMPNSMDLIFISQELSCLWGLVSCVIRANFIISFPNASV